MHTHLILCLDGIGPEYLAASQTPTLDALSRSGWRHIGLGAMPAVTNVNNVSIVTASPPAAHGITSNYYFDRATKQAVYMESADFILAPTLFERATQHGKRSVVVTAKDKLRTLLARGASDAISAETPPQWITDALGAPPPILSVEVNHWLCRAAAEVYRRNPPDLMYLTLTDFAQHQYAPETAESQENLATLDALIGDILNTGPEFNVMAAADHGMRAKTLALDLGQILRQQKIVCDAVPIIKDRYVAHHQNLGGAAYIFLDDMAQLNDAIAVLRAERGVESVWTRAEAATEFQLYHERIGDLFVLSTEEVVFGSLPTPRENVVIRSHGCLRTRVVPIIVSGPAVPRTPFTYNYEIAGWIEW
jgi:phosphonoacetate hydrolase